MEKYAMYLRKSRADLEAEAHGEGETLARHKKLLLELAKNKNIVVADIYEEVVSGDSIEGRPQIKRLLSAVEKREYTGVLCMDIDRLARGDTIDQGIIARAFRMSGTKIVTPKKEYDPHSEFDEEYFEFELFMARREFKIIGRRIQRGRVQSAKEGRFIGSTAPYGYRKIKIANDKGYTLEPNPNEAKAVRLIYELYLNGDGKAAVAQKLNALGIRPRSGNNWSAASVSNILKNPVYIGKVRWGYRKCAKELENGAVVKRREKNTDCVYADGIHPPIISEADFNKVRELLSARYCPPKRADTELKNPLAGLIFCGKCGAAMIRLGENKRSKYAALKCSDRYCGTVASKLYLVELSVMDFLEDWIKEHKIKVENISPHSGNATELCRQKLDGLKLERDRIKKQLENTFDLLEQGIYTPEIFKERSAALSQKLTEIERSVADAEREIKNFKDDTALRDNFVPHFENLLDIYRASDDVSAKNRLLKALIRRITYTKSTKNTRRDPDRANFRLVIEPLVK